MSKERRKASVELREGEKKILIALSSGEEKRYKDLLMETGLARPSLTENLNLLEKKGLITKEGKRYSVRYRATPRGIELGREVLEEIKRVDAVRSATKKEEVVKKHDIESLMREFVEIYGGTANEIVESTRKKPPPTDFLAKVAPKGIVTPLVKVPFLGDVLVKFRKEEREFYEFLTRLYLESLKIYGPPGIKFTKELFGMIKKELIRRAIPKIKKDEVDKLSLRLLIEFDPNSTYDELLLTVSPQLRRELEARKNEILKDFLEKLFGIKVEPS